MLFKMASCGASTLSLSDCWWIHCKCSRRVRISCSDASDTTLLTDDTDVEDATRVDDAILVEDATRTDGTVADAGTTAVDCSDRTACACACATNFLSWCERRPIMTSRLCTTWPGAGRPSTWMVW